MVGLTDVAAVLGTYLVFAAFLTLTAHIAARNVMGDVRFDRAIYVGPVTAAVSFLFLAVLGPRRFVPLLAVPVAVAVDLTMIQRSYEIGRRLGAYVTFIHFVVTVILAAVIGSSLVLLTQSPEGAAGLVGVGL
jgi:hypothetical protein